MPAPTPAKRALKLNPVLGRRPVLQFVPPHELEVDPSCQRSLDTGGSIALIRKIAANWNWDLCQPLIVARRQEASRHDAKGGISGGDRLYVIDGQHRLSAARLRGDLSDLPCVIVNYASPADEAASFVKLNQQRAPLTKIDLFKASLASGDPQARAIMDALDEAGLTLAPHTNPTAWKPGMLGNVGGIEAAWRSHGPDATTEALRVLAQAFAGQVLAYAGTIFPGVAAVAAREADGRPCMHPLRREQFITLLQSRSQTDWRTLIQRTKGENPGLKFAAASALAVGREWEAAHPARALPSQRTAAPLPAATRIVMTEGIRRPSENPFALEGQRAWCNQCEARVSRDKAGRCTSSFCKLRGVA